MIDQDRIGPMKLADLRDASHLHNRTLSLSLRKSVGLLAVGVSAGEHFAVVVENLGFEMMVLPAVIFSV